MATKSNLHGNFWVLLKQIPGYKDDSKESMKAFFVEEYTEGRTSSLSEMYNRFPMEYSQMIQALKKLSPKDKLDKERDTLNKRLLRVMCLWVDGKGYKFQTNVEKIAYVKGIACRKASCKSFNKIPKSLLNDFYHAYCRILTGSAPLPDADYDVNLN